MPRVPVVNQIASSGPADQYSRVQATPESFGASYYRGVASLGQSISQAGADFDQAAEVVRRRDNVLKAQEASLAMDSEIDDLLNGEEGFYRLRGTDATKEAGDAYEKKLRDIVNRYAGPTTDPDVARRVRSYGISRLSREIGNMGRYAAQQSFQATQDLTEARLNKSVQSAVAARNSPVDFEDALTAGVDVIQTNAALLGWSPEVVEQKVNEFTSTVTSKTLDAFAETYDVEGAEKFYRENRDALSPTERDDAVAKIKSMERARSAEVARQRATATAAREEYKRQTGNTFFEKLANNDLTAAEVMASDLPALGPGGKREWMQMIQEGATGKAVTNPAVFNELFRRINLPEGDPQRITDSNDINQYLGAGLDYQSVKQLRGEVNTKDTPEGRSVFELRKNLIRTARNTLSGSNDLLGLRDPEGDAKFQQWLSWFLDAEEKARKSNDFGPNYYNPARPDIYLGGTVDSFKRSDGDALKSQIDALDNPNDAAPADVVDVNTIAEVEKLPSGTRFRFQGGPVRTRN